MTNFDDKTGIHYGAISYHSVIPEALDDVFIQGDNLTYKEAMETAKASLRSCLGEWFNEGTYGGKPSTLDRETDAAWDAISDTWNDQYQGEDEVYLYEQYGYKISNSPSLVCLFVENSPWYTFARPCSPCAPNAGDLDNSELGQSSEYRGLKTYCLGPDWFEDNKAPYPVYSVADGSLVESSVTVAASDTEGENTDVQETL
ncbi:MAG TPA: hypothetical protein VNZ86_06555 [Bacteroidia bacterium]|jgi:hypothetical protein|nr:hypothetical protein [Bacteroidia bacterium]